MANRFLPLLISIDCVKAGAELTHFGRLRADPPSPKVPMSPAEFCATRPVEGWITYCVSVRQPFLEVDSTFTRRQRRDVFGGDS